VLTVAHRLETIALSDKVLVMHHGTAAEFGHPRELLADPSSHFHALWHGRSRKPKETFTQGGFDPNKTNFDELERRLD
jgi:ABC-type proline/glycine betaine transport system ATPase subunit